MRDLLDVVHISESSDRKYFDTLQSVTVEGDYQTFGDVINKWWDKYEKEGKENEKNTWSHCRYNKSDEHNTETLDTATYGLVSRRLDKSKCVVLYKYSVKIDRTGDRPYNHEIKTVAKGKKAAAPEKLQANRCMKFHKSNCLELDSSKGKIYCTLDDNKSNVFIGLTAESIYVVDPKIMDDPKNFEAINSAIMEYCRKKSL